jgi:hypothetical protein
LRIFILLTPDQLARKLEPLPDQIQLTLRSRDSRRRLLLEGMKHVNRFPKLCHIHRTI